MGKCSIPNCSWCAAEVVDLTSPALGDGQWDLVKGYPVVFDEQYIVSGWIYYADAATPANRVWRRPNTTGSAT